MKGSSGMELHVLKISPSMLTLAVHSDNIPFWVCSAGSYFLVGFNLCRHSPVEVGQALVLPSPQHLYAAVCSAGAVLLCLRVWAGELWVLFQCVPFLQRCSENCKHFFKSLPKQKGKKGFCSL